MFFRPCQVQGRPGGAVRPAATHLKRRGAGSYWSPDSGTSEVDVVIQSRGETYPIEVKATENLQAKSLRIYREKHKPRVCVRVSLSGYRKEDWLVNIPLYALCELDKVLRRE